ncbi:hypothetical protein ATCC90586_006361 [Pythium insidiosum]|nr:hypothetical protein ATCC90586_006361 [Pythium insidiosum]
MGGTPTPSECVDDDESDAEEKAEAPQVEESTGAAFNPPRSGSLAAAAAAAGGAGSPGSDDSDCERKRRAPISRARASAHLLRSRPQHTYRQAQQPPINSLWIEDSPDRMRDSPDSPRTLQRRPQAEVREATPRARSPGTEGPLQEVFFFNGRQMTILDALEPVVMTARQLRDFRKICSREGRGRDDMNGLPYVLHGRETRHELEERFWA